MKTVGYYNGKITPVDELSVPALDRAVYFGDGVYDVVLCRNGKPFTLDMHVDRFYNSCRALEIEFPMQKEELKALLLELVAMADDADTMIYWQASRGTAPRTHEYPQNGAKANLLVMITPLKLGDLRKPIRLMTVEDIRFLHCDIKTINLIPNVMAAEKGHQAGCGEIIFHRGDRVTEGAHSSILLLEGDKVVLPPLDQYVLPGITRRVIEQLCEKNGIPYERRVFTLDELMEADEILVASTTKHFVPAEEVDGQKVGGKAPALLKKLQDLFLAELAAQTE